MNSNNQNNEQNPAQTDKQIKQQVMGQMAILCADGNIHGQVEQVSRDHIKVTPDSNGESHWIPLSAVDHVDERIHLKWSHHEVMEKWLNKDPQAS